MSGQFSAFCSASVTDETSFPTRSDICTTVTDRPCRSTIRSSVCAAAVILPRDLQIEGLNDSKKLTDKKRRELFDVITAQAVSYGIAFSDEKEIDEINILQATFRAMARAMAARGS